jgi:hypothetical protein
VHRVLLLSFSRSVSPDLTVSRGFSGACPYVDDLHSPVVSQEGIDQQTLHSKREQWPSQLVRFGGESSRSFVAETGRQNDEATGRAVIFRHAHGVVLIARSDTEKRLVACAECRQESGPKNSFTLGDASLSHSAQHGDTFISVHPTRLQASNGSFAS